MHDRYAVSHDFLSPETGDEVLTISRLVNAFFRWEFNSCESLVRDGEAHPIDYANASPDVAVTSLHYYFPWAMTALLRWSAFCAVTGRELARVDVDRASWFAIGDRRTSPTPRSWPSTGGWPTTTSRSRLPGVLRHLAGARRRAGARLGRLGRLRPAAGGDRRRPTRRTSTSASSLTSAAWSGCGCASADGRRRARRFTPGSGAFEAHVWQLERDDEATRCTTTDDERAGTGRVRRRGLRRWWWWSGRRRTRRRPPRLLTKAITATHRPDVRRVPLTASVSGASDDPQLNPSSTSRSSRSRQGRLRRPSTSLARPT